MRNLIFIIWSLMLLASIVMTISDAVVLKWWIVGLSASSLLMLILFRRMALLPGRVANRGFELLSSQDFNNRLVPVGERNADRIVNLFNEMIDRLRGERLKNLEQDCFLRLLIDASPMGVLMLDLDGKISMGNPAFLRLSGLGSEKEIIGKKVEELPSEIGGQLKDVAYKETRLLRPGDSRLFRCSHLSFVQSGFNRHFYLVENLTEEVMKAEKSAYEKVIRTISHEVNNTMGGVKAVFGLLTDDDIDDEMKAVIESCDSRCEEMCGFIRAYADVVKTPTPELRDMELGGMVENMLPFLRMIAGDEIEVRLQKSEGEMWIKGDRAQLEQVMVNIVKNAVESFDEKTPAPHPVISIELSRRDGICLEISNNGTPISPEVAPHLFSPFFTTKPDGKGLGLTLTGEILGNHKAVWRLQTDTDGITRFAIRFRRF